MRDKLIIVGTGAIADVIADYLEGTNEYDIEGFSVDKNHIGKALFRSRPVVPFEKVEQVFPPERYKMFVAIGYVQLNYLRARFYTAAKDKGYSLISYVSPHAYMHHNVVLGDNCFIFENNVLQYDVTLGNDVILWSGNHIGHSTILRDHVYVASHVVISGNCDVGDYTFFGVNAAVADSIEIGKRCVIGMGANIINNTKDDQVYVPGKSINFGTNKLKGDTKQMFCPPEV